MNERAKISRKKGTASDISYPSLAPKIPSLAIPKNDSNLHSAIPRPETVQRETSQEQENQQDIEQGEIVQAKLNISESAGKQESSPLHRAFQPQGNQGNSNMQLPDSSLGNINYLENISIHRPKETVQRQEVEEEKEESEQGEVVQAKCNECDKPKGYALGDRQQEKQQESKLVQTKLTVGEPGDKYEQEADSVAAKVVEQINSTKSEQLVQGKIEPVVQPTVMRQGGIGGENVNEDVEKNIQQARGGGQGLADNVREPMEQAFGSNFSGVKVHTDGQSDVLNRSLNARAFTTGQDIFFKQGEYQPGSKQGQELLAHELTHVVQQGGSSQKEVQELSNNYIHRFESNEHKAMGDQGTSDSKGKPIQIQLADGLTVSFGDITAMAGDYFESVQEIQKLAKKSGDGYTKANTSDEIRYVLQVKVHGDKTAEKKFGEDVKKAVSKRYYTLAGKNKTHFTNPTLGDQQLTHEEKAQQRNDEGKTVNNAGSYRANHIKAIHEAVTAGNKKEPKDVAMLYEAFASHFLTDAYASGHMRTPRESISEYWNDKVPMFWTNLKWWMAENVAQHINDNNWRGAATVQYIWEEALSTFDEILQNKGIPDLTFGDVIAGAVHDYDNEQGIQASIGGEKVKLLGDDQVLDSKDRLLAAGIDTMTKVKAGVKASLKDIEIAYAKGKAGEADTDKVIASLKLQDGLFRAEQLWPQALPDNDSDQTNKTLNWQVPKVEDLFKNSRMKKALAHFSHEKAETLASEVSFKEKYQEQAFKEGVLDKLTAAPSQVTTTFLEIINYTPGKAAALGGIGNHDTDDNAVDYYDEVIKKKGLKGLTFQQKEKLIRDILKGATIGKEDLMIVNLLDARSEDAPKLIKKIGWHWLWQDLNGNDCRNFVQKFGSNYWSKQSYDAKKKEIAWLADGITNDLAQETIITILRTCSSGEVRKIDKQVGGWTGLAFDLTGKWDDEFTQMKN
ncbi:MAG: DUF4157 domain-containing protein [Cyanobacteriota bacterium]|nr:DUF4157 domain-containing protein [Cyanobacteriota bacterium]